MQDTIQLPEDYVKPESKFFCFYRSYCEMILACGDAQAGRMIKAMAAYYLDGTLMPMKALEAPVFSLIKHQIDTDRKKYDKVCERNWANAQSRRKKESSGSQSDPVDVFGD